MSSYRITPGFCEGITLIRKGRVKLGLGGQTWLVEPRVPVHRLERVRSCRVGGGEEVKQCLLELVRVEGLVRPLCEVVGDEAVKSVTTDQLLQVT